MSTIEPSLKQKYKKMESESESLKKESPKKKENNYAWKIAAVICILSCVGFITLGLSMANQKDSNLKKEINEPISFAETPISALGTDTKILLPNEKNVELSKWPVVACDQFTSQPEYWKEAEKIVGDYMLNLVRNHEAQWYEGTTEVLDLLKAQGYHMVILSNSKYLTGKTHFEEFDMGRWFDKWYDCESFGWAPKTEIIKSVQSDYPGELVLIGDRKSDLDAALSIGSKFIGCLYGFGSEDELEGATHLISSISELPSCFTHND